MVSDALALATRQGACGFGVETPAGAKNACDTVVAAFFEVNPDRYRDAFRPKARSPCLITMAYGVGYPVVISNVRLIEGLGVCSTAY